MRPILFVLLLCLLSLLAAASVYWNIARTPSQPVLLYAQQSCRVYAVPQPKSADSTEYLCRCLLSPAERKRQLQMAPPARRPLIL